MSKSFRTSTRVRKKPISATYEDALPISAADEPYANICNLVGYIAPQRPARLTLQRRQRHYRFYIIYSLVLANIIKLLIMAAIDHRDVCNGLTHAISQHL